MSSVACTQSDNSAAPVVPTARIGAEARTNVEAPEVCAISGACSSSTPRLVDAFERVAARRAAPTQNEAAFCVRVSDGVVEGEFYVDAPRVAGVLTGIMTGCISQTMSALYLTAQGLAQASTRAVSTGVYNVSMSALSALLSASTWPLRRVVGAS